MSGAILAIGILVFLAHFFTAVFKKTRVPDVLLLMGLGLIGGPGLHLVQPEDFGKVGNVMSTLALVVILFESGITISPAFLRKALQFTISLTIPTFVATFASAYAVACTGSTWIPWSGAWRARSWAASPRRW